MRNNNERSEIFIEYPCIRNYYFVKRVPFTALIGTTGDNTPGVPWWFMVLVCSGAAGRLFAASFSAVGFLDDTVAVLPVVFHIAGPHVVWVSISISRADSIALVLCGVVGRVYKTIADHDFVISACL
jgi:hypothetical protein